MINYANNSKEVLSATVTPKSFNSRNSYTNPLNPKNLPIKHLLINIPKDIPFNSSIETPKTARNNYGEGKSAKKSSFFNRSIYATPEKLRESK